MKRIRGHKYRLMGLLLVLCGVTLKAKGDESDTAAGTIIPIDHRSLILAPYVWKISGEGLGSRAEAAMPGAYIKLAFEASSAIDLIIDGSANEGCPPQSMPVLEYSIDEGAFIVSPLVRTDGEYRLKLRDKLDPRAKHRLDLFFRASDLTLDRWGSTKTRLRIKGVVLDAGAKLMLRPSRPRRAIAFGDSITEGVGVDGLFSSWQSLGVNNARFTWFPVVCAALDCEYGQLGSGGQGMTRQIHLPPLPQSWDRFDAKTTRLTAGKLLPEPDYIYCAMGTNDYDKDITADYIGWLRAMRAACPDAIFFCVVPPLGVHEAEIRAAVSSRRKDGDLRVHVIDTSPLRAYFRANQGATQLGYDGVHPSQYGQALLGALIATQSQEILTQTQSNKGVAKRPSE